MAQRDLVDADVEVDDGVDVVDQFGLEHESVGTGAADQPVEAVVAVEEVLPLAADQHIAAAAAAQQVASGSADQGIVAFAALETEQQGLGRHARRIDAIVAAKSLDDEVIAGSPGIGMEDRRRGVQAAHLDAGAPCR